jgi:hypothetical protein
MNKLWPSRLSPPGEIVLARRPARDAIPPRSIPGFVDGSICLSQVLAAARRGVKGENIARAAISRALLCYGPASARAPVDQRRHRGIELGAVDRPNSKRFLLSNKLRKPLGSYCLLKR